MLREEIMYLMAGKDLSEEMTMQAFDKIMGGEVNDVQLSAFLTAISIKGESVEEITAAAKIMRKYCEKLNHTQDSLDIVGTGGDKSNSFNISTTSSIVLSAAGIPVTKHGNRAATSKCGSADVLEALGINIDCTPEKSAELLNKTGFCFLFANKYHTAMRYVGPVRRQIGIKTIFNLIGPLSNPASPTYQLMGVFDEMWLEPLAQVLINVGLKNVAVVYGRDGLDEVSLSGETAVCEIIGGKMSKYVITPEQFGFERCTKADLLGGTAEENAEIAMSIFKGEKGHRRNVVVLNCMMAYHVVRPELPFDEVRRIIEDTIDSGKSLAKIEELRGVA